METSRKRGWCLMTGRSVAFGVRVMKRLPAVFACIAATAISAQAQSQTYNFAHLAFGANWQITLTYVNYSPQAVSCQTAFYSDSGGALQVPFTDGTVSSRSDDLAAGASLHVSTQAASSAPLTTGWAQAQCTGPAQASLLYRLFNGNTAQGEASVNASTNPTTEFASFAQTATGLAYADPSSTAATITITALDSTGKTLGSKNLTVQPNAHGAANIGPFLGLASFTGSVQVTSTEPIVALFLNAEAFPVFSSLPPADLSAGTALSTGGGSTGGGGGNGGGGTLPQFGTLLIKAASTATQQPELGITDVEVFTSPSGGYIGEIGGVFYGSTGLPDGQYAALWGTVTASGLTLTFTGLETTGSTMELNGNIAQVTSATLTVTLTPQVVATSGTVKGTLNLVSTLATVSGSFTGTYVAQ